MANEWGSGNGRNGSRYGSSRPSGGAGRDTRGPSRMSGDVARDRDSRWSNELDAIFERAPKETANPAKDDEKNFFEERSEIKPHTLLCPNCNQPADYALTWLVRRKRDHPAGFADDATRARFEKARSYMVRREDAVTCQNVRCRKRFEIAGVQTVAFLQDAAAGSVADRAARVRAAFANRNRGEE